jgi:hypothetical protein
MARRNPKKYTWNVIAKAQPDECFQGIGNPANLSHALGFFTNYPGDLTESQKAACRAIAVSDYVTCEGQAQPKVNQAYVWGLTRHLGVQDGRTSLLRHAARFRRRADHQRAHRDVPASTEDRGQSDVVRRFSPGIGRGSDGFVLPTARVILR